MSNMERKTLSKRTIQRKRFRMKMEHLRINPTDICFRSLGMPLTLQRINPSHSATAVTANGDQYDADDDDNVENDRLYNGIETNESTSSDSLHSQLSSVREQVRIAMTGGENEGRDDEEMEVSEDETVDKDGRESERDREIRDDEEERTDEEGVEGTEKVTLEEDEWEIVDEVETETAEEIQEEYEEQVNDDLQGIASCDEDETPDKRLELSINDSEDDNDNDKMLEFGMKSLLKVVFKRNISVLDVVARVAAVAIRSNLTYVALIQVLRVVASLTHCKSIPKTMKRLWSLLSRNDGAVSTRHYYCEKCFDRIGSSNEPIRKCACEKYGPETKLYKVPYFIQLSLTCQLRQLLETPTMYEALQYRHTRNKNNASDIEDIYDGHQYKKLSRRNGFLDNDYNFSLTLNTDGCSVSNSSNASAWPVLLQINELPPHARKRHILLGGIWIDTVHPQLHVFLIPVMAELQQLYNVGVKWTNPVNGKEVTSKFVTVACSVDTPARSDILNMTRFNGDYGCTFCYNRGARINGTVPGRVYPTEPENCQSNRRSDDELRSDMSESYANNCTRRKRGVIGPSPLMMLPGFNLSSGMIVESMHNLFLGVTKLHTTLLLFGKATEKWYIGTPNNIATIDRILSTIKRPSKISRAPRSVNDMNQWKASEWRNWIAYYAPVCLADKMHLEHVRILSFLSRAAYIYNGDCITVRELQDARSLIKEYVERFQAVFGVENMKFNVHLLTHLPETVENWGPLWSHTAFPFEAWNRKIIDSITGPNGRHLQVVTRHMLSTFVHQLLFDQTVAVETKLLITEALYGGSKLSLRRNHHDNLNAKVLQVRRMYKTCEPSADESLALEIAGNANVTEVSYFKGASISGLNYERHDTSMSDKKYCDGFIYWQSEFFKIMSIVQFIYDSRIKCGFFARKMIRTGCVAHAYHIQEAQMSTTEEFIPIENEGPTPAIAIPTASGSCIVKLPNLWESD